MNANAKYDSILFYLMQKKYTYKSNLSKCSYYMTHL